ncbi:MAG TPA: Ppx/GppA phosphatase family protein [Frankiaceae bacterium]|nr:Ppx/GppA phosphatase family protein [Frankiaceae bacterium]
MRLGVLDVGSNTIHLLVVDAHPGAAPLPAASIKTPLRLSQLLSNDGSLGPEGARKLCDTLVDARREAEKLGAEDLLAFATSAVRDATNAGEVLADVRRRSGVDLQVLPGDDEARLTFLAVRRWFGWSAGRLLALDIGGGSLEVACGQDEDPDVAASLPLGASRLTRDWLPGDPPKRSAVAGLRKYVKAQVAGLVPRLYELGEPDRVVATSKTFRSLARIAGAAPYSKGPYVRRVLTAADAEDLVGRLAKMPSTQRTCLPGVSADRADQLLAGAVVAAEAMNLLGVGELDICPWALREGVILRRLDHLQPG